MNVMPERSSRATLGGALLAVMLAACTPPGGPHYSPEVSGFESKNAPPKPASPSSTSSKEPEPKGAKELADPNVPGPLLPLVGLEDSLGQPTQAPDAAFEPMRVRMKECTGGKSGLVRVRIKSDKNRTSMDIEPGSSLDGRAHRCVLETLSTVDVDDVVSRASPSDRPASGFTSIVRVQW